MAKVAVARIGGVTRRALTPPLRERSGGVHQRRAASRERRQEFLHPRHELGVFATQLAEARQRGGAVG